MRLVGMMPCRNEDWVLGTSARVALEWCDALVILNHCSTDGSNGIIAQLLSEYGDRIRLSWCEGDWVEMEHRQRMLDEARRAGATHLAIVDADEILSANVWQEVRAAAARMQPDQLMQLPGYNLRNNIGQYHANGIWGDRWFSTVFMDSPRLNWAGDRFHHREPMGMALQPYRPIPQGHGGTLHLWGVNERRLKAKHALYKMTETLRWPQKSHAEIDKLYSLAFDPRLDTRFAQHWSYAAVPAGWFAHSEHLHLNVIPWQEAECRTLFAEHGADRFADLNLFDVCRKDAA